MRIPLAWLRDYVPLAASAGEIAERLALLGFPVGAIETRPALSGVIAGEIVELAKHPNADRLQLCTLDVGADAPLSIITAATNVAHGQIVPVATLGAQLVGMTIAPRTMRGIASQGMLCSANELGLPEEWFEDGILQLDPDTKLGSDVIAQFRLGDEILEVEVTPNRPDAMSIVGLARELGAAFGVPLTLPPTGVAYAEGASDVPVTLESSDCHRFVVQRVANLHVRTAKTWMRVRLALAGQRPINNAVDVSNFVMLEVGQPLHFYDVEKLAGGRLIVRDARAGEPMTTLDGIERVLDPSVLVIADAEQPQCIAGIKGAAASEVSASTSEIAIEAANFDGPRVRRTGIALALRTDASARHEKALPLALTDLGAARAARLLVEEGATAFRPDTVGAPVGAPAVVALPPTEIPRLLGFTLPPAEIAARLRPLGFEVTGDGAEAPLAVTIPLWRSDVAIPADLIEELARMVGYDRIEPALPTIPPTGMSSTSYDTEQRLAQLLAGLGYHEMVTLALQPGEVGARLRAVGIPVPEAIEIQNPLSEDQRFLRFSLLPGFLELAARQRTALPLRVFEVGHVFHQATDTDAEDAQAAWATFARPSAESPWSDPGFLAAKSDAEAVVRAVTGRHPSVQPASTPGLHPGKTAALQLDDVAVAFVGAFDPRALAVYELDAAAYATILRLGALPAYRTPRYRPLSRFPAIERDLAVVLRPDVPAHEVEQCAQQAADGLVRSVHAFDEYRGPQVGEDKKSLALRVVLQRDDRTLTDAEADAAMTAMLDALGERFGDLAAVTWPDLVIGAIALIAALRGYKRGFVAEMAGAVALVLGIIAAFHYDGKWDGQIEAVTHLGPGSAHVVGMVALALAVWAVLAGVAFLLGRVAKLPVIGIGNGLGGAAVGVAKAALLFWALLYVALFFPLSPDLRSDLHHSTLVSVLTEPNSQLDGTIQGWMPWFIRPLAQPFFQRHRD